MFIMPKETYKEVFIISNETCEIHGISNISMNLVLKVDGPRYMWIDEPLSPYIKRFGEFLSLLSTFYQSSTIWSYNLHHYRVTQNLFMDCCDILSFV